MNIILFDPKEIRGNLLPFTYTRPVAKIRCGILNLDEKWEQRFPDASISYLTQDYLSTKFKTNSSAWNILINGALFATDELANIISGLENGAAIKHQNHLLAAHVQENELAKFDETAWLEKAKETNIQNLQLIERPYDIFSKNGIAIEEDFQLITKNRTSLPIPEGNQVVCPERIFIEEGAKVNFSILNASTGPIYIGKNAEIMEGCKVRGPFALCEDGGLKMDAKIYGPTTVGPHCKVGGEVNNAVFFAYSNKGHDGFVGNAVIGEWVNMGADTNNSNLKNTYDEVKLWNYPRQRFEKTGLTFCGLMMADHAKCGINTMFNTGTVVGVGANIFGAGFPRNYVPDFSWGGAQGFETFILSKFYKTAEAMCKRRNIEFDDTDKAIYKSIFEETAQYRNWENNN
ncbi:MAG: GlmU family protein [Bacteroidetes bacterium]|nr:GlmU family protein [Bacteroidota bacterium]